VEFDEQRFSYDHLVRHVDARMGDLFCKRVTNYESSWRECSLKHIRWIQSMPNLTEVNAGSILKFSRVVGCVRLVRDSLV